jgi:monoamine oxidase
MRMAGADEREHESRERARVGRRKVLEMAGAAAVAIAAPRALAGCAAPSGEGERPAGGARASLRAVNADIGIVGAGIAGIACAYELKRSGVVATIHEASNRIGGRMFSMGGAFPSNGLDWMGQTIERGGELIDTPHKTIQGYAKELGLRLEDVTKPARETFYMFDGQRIPESTMVDEYRALVDGMRDDLRQIGAPTAQSFTPYERTLDNMSLAQWLDTRNAGANIKKLLTVAYCIEYGVEADKMSCLAFLLFAKASRQSKIRLWGNFSDERYHTIGGNQQIPEGLAARLPGQLRMGRKLLAAKKLSDGRIELTFDEGGKTVTARHDAVVLAIPFHLLRGVELDASLALPAWKRQAIANVIYGNNAKLMVGFVGRPWVEQGSNGAAYTDLPYLQTTWETDPVKATSKNAVITDYTGGALSRSLSPSRVQSNCDDFLGNFDAVYPGAKARARRDSRGRYVCHLEHWPSNPLTQGAYTANQPGYFTTIAGYEAPPVGNLYFAGETTDSFYSWQGFMEGGALSGVRVAAEINRDFG